MFTIEKITQRFVYIRSKKIFRIVPISDFRRARGRVMRGTMPRKAMVKVINGEEYLFTRKEWAKTEQLAQNYQRFCSGLPGSDRREITDKIKRCKRLAKQRAARIKLEADAAGVLINFNK